MSHARLCDLCRVPLDRNTAFRLGPASWPEDVPFYLVCNTCGTPLKALIAKIEVAIERRVHEQLKVIQL
jgi:hypothetical protein